MYKSLEYLPYKLFLKISETGQFHLLANEDKEPTDYTSEELAELQEAWTKLESDYETLDPSNEVDKMLKIEREVAYFKAKFKLVRIYCKILRFDWHQETADQIIEFGYILRDDENYYADIETIERESEGLLTKAEKFESMLPKKDLTKPDKKITVDQMLASISVILGFDFDYNTVSVTKVLAMQDSVSQKIKQLQAQSPKK